MPEYRAITLDEYRASFRGKPTEKARSQKAFEVAHDMRMFEIDLYWRRSTYFWAFVAASFTVYFLLATTKDSATAEIAWLRVSVATIGMAFSFAWHLVTRASKFWQENWERHIDNLETLVSGPLYQTILHPKKWAAVNPFAPLPVSVSRVNMLLSLLITAFWGILLRLSLVSLLDVCWVAWAAPIAVFVILIALFALFCRTEITLVEKKHRGNDKTYPFLRRGRTDPKGRA